MKMATSTTTIMDVSDDCLRETFKYFQTHDLEIVVDVCRRFKRLAEERFSRLKSKNFVFGNIYHECTSKENRLQETAKFFRDFGVFFERIFASCEENGVTNYAEKFIELLNRYCSKNLIHLELWHMKQNDDNVHKMQVPLQHLQHLNLKECTLSEIFLQKLALWSPELVSLQLVDIKTLNPECFIGLHQSYPKLERILFEKVDMTNSDIEHFIKLNSQLKAISLIQCQNLNDDIIPVAAKYLPKIETFTFYVDTLTEHWTENFKQLSNLNGLNHLAMASMASETPILDLSEIGLVKLPLETLLLRNFDIQNDNDNFTIEISKLKKLNKLVVSSVNGLCAHHVLDICKNLGDLSVLYLKSVAFMLSTDDLLQLVRNAENLTEIFHIETDKQPAICIPVDTYVKIVDIIQARSDQKYLELKSNCYCFHSVPDELIEKYKNCFKHIYGSGKNTESEMVTDEDTDTEEETAEAIVVDDQAEA